MQSLIDAVQHNCDIVDARHGADYGMCTYLLKMRELFRWQRGLSLGARLAKDEIGDWLTERERRLECLEGADFCDLPIGDDAIDPFDAEAVNAALGDTCLVYSAGLIHGARPHFFLAELESEQRAESGFVLRVSGRELARCLNAPPAMTRGTTIFLRRESLRRYVWEKYESWLWNRPEGAMSRTVACYPFETDLETALEHMTAAEMDVVAAHEHGEYEAGRLLGEAWDTMLLDLALTPAELMARAVRDHLADCTHTLPLLLEEGREASLHFYLANLGAMRKQLAPSIETAYRDWLDHGHVRALSDVARRGRDHWRGLAERMLALHRAEGVAAASAIAAEVEAAPL